MKHYLEKENAIDIAQWLSRDPETGEVTIDEKCPWVVRTKPNAKPQIRCWSLNPEKQKDYPYGNLHSLQMFAWVVLGKNPYPGKRQIEVVKGHKLNMNPDHLRLKPVREKSKSKSKAVDWFYPYDLMRDEDKELQNYLHWLAKSPAIRTLMQEIKQSLAGKKDNMIAKMLFADILLSDAKQYDKANEFYDIVQAIREIQSKHVVSLLRQQLKG